MMRASGLGVRRRGALILGGIDLALQPGELLAVAGPNGAGKSTLLQALAGDCKPDAGSVVLDGRPLSQWKALDLARRRAVMPQAARLGFALPGREVVRLGRIPFEATHTAAANAAAVEAALDSADARSFAARSYATLSGGEQQRIQLARAVAQLEFGGAPPLLLLDEPTASLDLAHAHGVLHLAQQLARRGAAVAAVLHDLSLALRYADRVMVLDRGRMAALGAPSEVITAGLMRRVFGVEAEIAGGHILVKGPVARQAA